MRHPICVYQGPRMCIPGNASEVFAKAFLDSASSRGSVTPRDTRPTGLGYYQP